MIEAAAQSFLAARQRYREKKKFGQRVSRSSSGKSLDRNSLAGTEGETKRRIISRHSGRELQLDDTDCEQLSTAFAALPDKYHLFERMFLRLFLEMDPQIALTFGMTNIPENELRRKTPFRVFRFRTHVCKFQRFITTVMDLLPKRGREEELVQIIRMVGRQHCQVKQLSFTAARWLSFKAALLWTFSRGVQQKNKSHGQWSVLISFLIYEIKDAYLAHIRTLRSNSLPHIVETYRLEFHRRKKSQAQFGALPALPPPTPSPTERQTRDFEEERNCQSNRGKTTEDRSAHNQKM
ncbi:hypothetical protein niasHT_013583 [Heterodera trifolii]|uniref:Globin family profile domain-containing protein n=1 Tax=Heterodera trifolii TaxID=157864 RepID=A0ABD2LEA4_9BILA